MMHNYQSNQSVLLTRCGTDSRHRYRIFGGKSQTSFSRNATQVGSEEGRLFSQARHLRKEFQSFVILTVGKQSSSTKGVRGHAHMYISGSSLQHDLES